MRIIILINTFFPHIGGAETAVHNLAEGLVSAGHEVMVGCAVPEIKGAEYERSYRVVRYRLPRGSSRLKLDDWFLALAAASTVRRWQPDLILANFAWPVGYAALQIRRFSKTPVIVISHGGDIDVIASMGYGLRLNPRINKKIEWVIRHADGLIAISKRTKAEYLKMGASAERIASIPNGINYELLSAPLPDARQTLGIPRQSKVILSVGRNHPVKGYDNLIRMVPAVVDKVKEALFVLVGENISALADLVAQNHVAEHVMLCEKVLPAGLNRLNRPTLPMQTITAYYQAADVFAMPSFAEGLPMVGIEAMASGLPIVATQIPGTSDLIRDGLNGVLVPPGNNAAFADALIGLLQQDALRLALGKEARENARQFDRVRVANQVINFARQINK